MNYFLKFPFFSSLGHPSLLVGEGSTFFTQDKECIFFPRKYFSSSIIFFQIYIHNHYLPINFRPWPCHNGLNLGWLYLYLITSNHEIDKLFCKLTLLEIEMQLVLVEHFNHLLQMVNMFLPYLIVYKNVI